MNPKNYSSFSQIEADLEILALERKIAFEKMKLGVTEVKDSLMPSTIVSKAWHNVTDSAIHLAQKLLGN